MNRDSSHPLLDPWTERIQAEPDAPAVVEPATDRTWSFRALEERAEELAGELRTRKIRGIPVAFRERNGGEWVARFLALLRVEAPALPLDSSTPDQGIREIATRCGAVLWKGEKEFLPPPKYRRYRSPAIALLKLTSGTTGEPGAIAFRPEELAADGWNVMRGMGIGPGNRNFGLIPFGHSYGLGNLIMPLLLAGVPIVCGSSPLPHLLAAEFAAGGANVLPAVPALFAGLARAEADLPGLRLAISAGAPLPVEIARGFEERFGRRLHNFLGSSESGGIAYDESGEAGLAGRGVGRPLPGVTITFDRRSCLVVSSAAVFTRGNRRVSAGQGCVVLGDQGEINPRGELVLKGRIRPMIKVGARRLDPAEVERALMKVAGVKEAWATAWRAGGEERPAAVVAGAVRAECLREALRVRLPAWKIPRPLIVLSRLPLTQRGKVDRAALEQLLKEAGERRPG